MLKEDAIVVGSSLTLAAIEESWRVITVVLREDVVVIGSSLALVAIEESWSNIAGVLKEGVGDSRALAAIEES